jgi:hypothetical protein
MAKEQESYRIYDDSTPEHVKSLYKLNHTYQTVDFVFQKKAEYLPLRKGNMGIWEAVALFDTLVDESDPDLDLPQRYHLFQTAEALRRDGHPRWLILTGFVHDLGKILEKAYTHLMDARNREMLPLLELFSHYDLYSKSPEKLDLDALMPYYYRNELEIWFLAASDSH